MPLSGYSFSEAIGSLDHLFLSGDLTGQTVVIHIDSTHTQFWANEDGDGTYARFTLDDESTLLKFEVESYDNSGNDAWFHVKIPTLSASAQTLVYIQYGHASPSDGSDKENTWDSSYKAVYHWNTDKAEGAFDDSTSNNQDGTNHSSIDAAGKIDRAIDTDGSTTYVDIGTLPTMTSWTLETWVNSDTLGDQKCFLSNDLGGWNDDILWGIAPEGGFIGLNRITIMHQDAVSTVRTYAGDTTDIVIGEDYHVVATSDGSTLRLYVNGIEVDSASKNGTALTFNGAPTWIGATPNAFRGFNGRIDETTISNVARSADWVAARYRSGLAKWGTLEGSVKRVEVTITGTVTGAQTDYWLKVEVPIELLMSSDYTDVRFRASDGTTQLNQFLYKYDTLSAFFMVEVPSIPEDPDTVVIYYYYNTGETTLLEPPITSTACMDDFRSTRFPRVWEPTGSNFWGGPDLVAQGTDIVVASWWGDDPNATSYITASSDRGQTWEDRGSVAVGAVPGLEVTPNGDRLLLTGGMLADSPNSLKFTYSTDGGDNWSSPVTIVTGRTADSALVAISNTEYLVATVDSATGKSLDIYETTDSGANWSLRTNVDTLSVVGEDIDLYFADNGDLLCSIEEETTEQGKSEIYLYISSDDGETWGSKIGVWTQGATTIDYEQAGFFTDLDSGNLVHLVYTNEGDVFDSDYSHYKLRYKTSDDNGATWSSSAEYCSQRAVGPENNTAIIESELFLIGYVPGTITDAYGVQISKFSNDLTVNYDVSMMSERFDNFQGMSYCFGATFDTSYVKIWPGANHGSDDTAFFESVATIPDDCRILARMGTASATDNVYLSFRVTDNDNRYEFFHQGTDPAINNTKVAKYVSGTPTTLNITSDVRDWSSGVDVEILLDGTDIEVYLDAALLFDFTDATYGSGNVALTNSPTATDEVRYYYFFAGKYVTPEPTYVLGDSENIAAVVFPEFLNHRIAGGSYNG
jgi:hypothetical protein